MTHRKPDARSVVLQSRDVGILQSLFECRVLKLEHVADLHFEGRIEAAKKRLQKLSAAGLIGQRPRRPFEPAVHFLREASFESLADQGILQRYPKINIPALVRRAVASASTIPHELAVADVKVAFARAIKALPRLALVEFTTWPLLNEFEAWGEIQKPDGFVRIHEKEGDGGLSEHCFFVEVDRSTERLEVLTRKASTYLDHYKSGRFAERCGGKRTEPQNYPFRVLMICKTAERRNNVAERLVQSNPPILTQVLLSTLAEATANPLGPIWVQPVDYRDGLRGSPYEQNIRQIRAEYVRHGAREQFVEGAVRKRSIITAQSA